MARAADRPTRRPGIAAGSDGDGDTVDRLEPALDPCDDPLDQRQQGFGMAARHRERLGGKRHLGIVRRDAGGAMVERCVDGQDTHANSRMPVRAGDRLPAAPKGAKSLKR